MKHRLIGLHNHQCQFELDGQVYIIPRQDAEKKLGLYWFSGGLYNQLIEKVDKNRDWLSKYKV